jgi:hypothetical protein
MRGQCLCAELGAGGQESQEQPGEQCRRSSGAHVRAADGRAVSGRNDPPSHGGELGGRPCVEIIHMAGGEGSRFDARGERCRSSVTHELK